MQTLHLDGKSPRERNIGNSRELLDKPVQALSLLFLKLFFPPLDMFKLLNSFMLLKKKKKEALLDLF